MEARIPMGVREGELKVNAAAGEERD